MDASIFLSFLTYSFVMSITPGPNNILALSCAGQYGFRNSFPLIMGISGGFATVMLLCGLCTLTLSHELPGMISWLTWFGAGYIVWLAWHIAVARQETEECAAQPPRFVTGFLLQFVNVKVMLCGLTAFSSFVLPYTSDMAAVVGYSLLLALVGALSTGVWGFAGGKLQAAFQRWGRGINVFLGLSLLYCAVRMFV